MIYRYTMLLKPIWESELMSFIGKESVSFNIEIPVEVESELLEEDKVYELDEKIGTKTPDGKYEFVGYKDLVKVININ